MLGGWLQRQPYSHWPGCCICCAGTQSLSLSDSFSGSTCTYSVPAAMCTTALCSTCLMWSRCLAEVSCQTPAELIVLITVKAAIILWQTSQASQGHITSESTLLFPLFLQQSHHQNNIIFGRTADGGLLKTKSASSCLLDAWNAWNMRI